MGQKAGPDLRDTGDGKGHQRLSADTGAVRECQSASWSVGCAAAADDFKIQSLCRHQEIAGGTQEKIKFPEGCRQLTASPIWEHPLNNQTNSCSVGKRGK